MKKNKKILLSLGTTAVVFGPLVTVVACGGSNDEGIKFKMPNISAANAIKPFKNVDLSHLKNYLVELNNPNLTKEKLAAVTPDDLQKYRKDEDLTKVKKDTIKQANEALLNYAFEENAGDPTDKINSPIAQLQKYVLAMGLASFANQSPSRGPFRTDATAASKSFLRKDFLYMRYASGFDGYDLVGSRFIKNDMTDAKRIMLNYNTYGGLNKGDRYFDPNMMSGNGFSSTNGSSTGFSLLRSSVDGEYKSTINPVNGKISWEGPGEITKQLLAPGLNIFVEGTKITTPTIKKIKNAFGTATKPSAGGVNIVKFSTQGEKAINYAKTNANGKIVDTNAQFKGKDLFYGFLRSFYSSKDLRNKGKFASALANQLGAYISKFTTAEKKVFEDAKDRTNNGNDYLFDLYRIDIPETLKRNFDNNGSNADHEFILAFKDLTPTAINLFIDNTSFQPFPKSKLVNGVLTKPATATQLRVNDYARPYNKGKVDVSEVYSIAPYLYTQYNTSESESIIIKQNPFYADQEWVKNDKSIKGIENKIKIKDTDSAAFITQRIKSFKDAENTREYLANPDILSQKSGIKDLGINFVRKKPRQNSKRNSNIIWNYYGFNDASFNKDGREMMWGHETSDNIKTNGDALATFFSGDGAKVRAAIHSAVNWYTMVQEISPGQDRESFLGISEEDNLKESNIDKSLIKADYLLSTSELRDIYNKNTNDNSKAWSTSAQMIANAAKTLDALATKVGATASNPAKIGIFKYIFKEVKPTQAALSAAKTILNRLNALTPKVVFVDQDYYTWKEFIKHSYTKYDSLVKLFGFGPDYKGTGSINQQYLTEYSANAATAIMLDALNQD